MKQYKQKEIAKLLGVEPRSVSRWNEDELTAKGITKHGEGPGCYYTREQDAEITAADKLRDTRAELELRKLKVEIAGKEQKLAREKRLMFQQWSDLYTEAFLDSFASLKDMLSESRFEQEVADKWNNAIDKCLENLQKKSENIYQSVDTNLQ